MLRELPSSPVSAPCCTALLEAHRKIFPLILVLLPPSKIMVLIFMLPGLFPMDLACEILVCGS